MLANVQSCRAGLLVTAVTREEMNLCLLLGSCSVFAMAFCALVLFTHSENLGFCGVAADVVVVFATAFVLANDITSIFQEPFQFL